MCEGIIPKRKEEKRKEEKRKKEEKEEKKKKDAKPYDLCRSASCRHEISLSCGESRHDILALSRKDESP